MSKYYCYTGVIFKRAKKASPGVVTDEEGRSIRHFLSLRAPESCAAISALNSPSEIASSD